MALEPWQVMLGLSGLLAVIAAFIHLGLTTPAGVMVGLTLLALTVLGLYVGYLMGKRWGERLGE